MRWDFCNKGLTVCACFWKNSANSKPRKEDAVKIKSLFLSAVASLGAFQLTFAGAVASNRIERAALTVLYDQALDGNLRTEGLSFLRRAATARISSSAQESITTSAAGKSARTFPPRQGTTTAGKSSAPSARRSASEPRRAAKIVIVSFPRRVSICAGFATAQRGNRDDAAALDFVDAWLDNAAACPRARAQH
jgi:hypothetical protein